MSAKHDSGHRRRLLAVLGFAIVPLTTFSSGCASTGAYLWVYELPPAEQRGSEYVISSGDMLSMRVLDHEDMTTRVKVRSDGRIGVPILGDIEVRGRTPAAVALDLQARLKPFFNAPSVTVNVEEFQRPTVVVLGEVTHPGSFLLDPGSGLAEALSLAGGLTDFADRERLFVVRRGPETRRIRFTYLNVIRGDQATGQFLLRNGDVVVVE
ncbi:MAG: polysaccharide biosynthesis/export family protein [Polyangiaceae bacterium]|jgi:polysaccharide export outer membrane protein